MASPNDILSIVSKKQMPQDREWGMLESKKTHGVDFPVRQSSRTVQIWLPLDTVQGLDSMLGFNYGNPQSRKEDRIVGDVVGRVDLKTGLVKVSPKELQIAAEWAALGEGYQDESVEDISADPRAVKRIKREWLRGGKDKRASGAIERLALRFLSSRQSPIHLYSEDATVPDIHFHYIPEPLEEIDTGHSVEQPGNRQETMTLDGVGYHLEQFHLHHPSEHVVDGSYFPMEMHFVHKSDSGEVAVVGVFFVEGAENEPLKQFFLNLPARKQTIDPPYMIDLGAILPGSISAYTYTGSLTTPPYTEGVHWVVFAQPVSASPEQIEAFRQKYHHNIRPLQDEAPKRSRQGFESSSYKELGRASFKMKVAERFPSVLNEKFIKKLKSDMRLMTRIYRSIDPDDADVSRFEEAQVIFNRFRDNLQKWVSQVLVPKRTEDKDESWNQKNVLKKAWSFSLALSDMFDTSWDYRTDTFKPAPWKLKNSRERIIRKYQKAFREFIDSLEILIRYEGEDGQVVRLPEREKVQIAGINVVIYGKGQESRSFSPHSEFLKDLRRQASVITRAGFGAALKGLTLFINYDRTDMVAGNYNANKDSLTIFPLGMSAGPQEETFIHEVGHRFYFRILSSRARLYWEEAFNGRGAKIEKADVNNFIKFYKKQRNPERIPRKEWSRIVDQAPIDPESQAKFKYLSHHIPWAWEADAEELREILLRDDVGDKVLQEYITDYGATDPWEAFAEAFQLYILKGPRRLGPWTRNFFEKITQGGRLASRNGMKVSGLFDDFDGFGDVEEQEEPLDIGLRLGLEKKLGESAQVLEAAPMFSGSVRNLIGDVVYYFNRKRAWFVYIDAPASQAVARAKRAQKKLRGSRTVRADQIILRGRTMYVGSNDGKLTRVKPIYKVGWEDHIPGGLADKKDPSDFDPKQLQMGIKVGQEHTNDLSIAEDIAMDHLTEIPDYYTRLKKMENKAERKAMRKQKSSSVAVEEVYDFLLYGYQGRWAY